MLERKNRSHVLVHALPLLFALTVLGCGARPNTDDVERVKQRFLELRFSAPFQARFRSLEDRELFALSCEQMRVKCPEVLELLKAADPAFYRNLEKPN